MTGLIVLLALTFAPQLKLRTDLPKDNITWVHRTFSVEEDRAYSDEWLLQDCSIALQRDSKGLVIFSSVVDSEKRTLTEIIELDKGLPPKIVCLKKFYSGPLVSCPPDVKTSGKTLFEEHFKEQAKELPKVVQDLLADLYVP